MKHPVLVLAAAATFFGGHAAPLNAGGIFGVSYNASVNFQDALGGTTMTLAFDGVNYWSSSGGSSDGIRFAQYTSAGVVLATFSPGLDFRSVVTDGSGTVFARQYADSTIYQQTSPGVFSSSGIILADNGLADESSVVLIGLKTEWITSLGGTVSRWDLPGNSLGTTSLIGFGSLGAEADYPQGRGIAAVGNYWLTYDGAGTLSAWDFTGHRVGTTILNDAGTSFDSGFSLSYANGMVFIVDEAGGRWRGYDVGLNTVDIPEPASLTLFGMGVAGMIGYRWKRKKQVAIA